MIFQSLKIINFRSIKYIEIDNLSSVNVIAGPNGCGKSNIFHAIRLLKSVYGGHDPDEWRKWFNEFNISLDMSNDQLSSIFRDKKSDVEISAKIVLNEKEKTIIQADLEKGLSTLVWSQINPNLNQFNLRQNQIVAIQQDRYGEIVNLQTDTLKKEILSQLEKDTIDAQVVLSLLKPDRIIVKQCSTLNYIFSRYKPSEIGMIDYHSSERNYNREQINSVNLNIPTTEQKIEQHALFDYKNKYSNIKTELATSYIHEVLAEKAGLIIENTSTLENSLNDLFDTFFPNKKFLGPKPTTDGRILFQVQTEQGIEHDINELSSGEKEILFGYLRLYNLSPKYSTMLLDEPELHLNPNLVQGLPQFYQRHLGKEKNNQIWILTHSDAMLREAFLTEDSTVYHMVSPEEVNEGENQLRKLNDDSEICSALINLVGDLATYFPRSKIIILEGGGSTEFDKKLLMMLFPKVSQKANIISGGSKNEVNKFYELLDDATNNSSLAAEVFSITDRDNETNNPLQKNRFIWDVYHIENYLLNSKYISQVINSVNNDIDEISEADVSDYLKKCATEELTSLVVHEMQVYANENIMNCIDFQFDPNSDDISKDLLERIGTSYTRIHDVQKNVLSLEKLKEKEKLFKDSFNRDLESGNWKSTFKGRDVLKNFKKKHLPGIPYKAFRNLIISFMEKDGFQPSGMKKVIEEILGK